MVRIKRNQRHSLAPEMLRLKTFGIWNGLSDVVRGGVGEYGSILPWHVNSIPRSTSQESYSLARKGDELEYALHFDFKASNNKAEYEALIAGIKMALDAGVENLIAYTDSQLITKQMEGEYEVKEERMEDYLQEIKALTGRLNDFQLHQIPRTENAKANYLAKLASSMINCSTRNITVRTLTKNSPEHNIMTIHGETDWRKPLLDYLEKDVLPPDEKEASRLKHRAARSTIGETPFNLVYGTDGVIPAEAGLETFRVQHYEPKNNDHLMRDNLDLIEELREDAQSRMERYKQRIIAACNRRVNKREFQVEDLVLRRAGATWPVRKLSPNWEGPFRVSRVIQFGAYELEDSEGRKLSRPWNICNLKKFFI
ncbi:UNVERIFIED_CONTAM: Ribonuclease HI [Sesamum latifolium]|uniref:Ribonuclease HI n=1 Tax=Sesamum latifolium TaxID=2727402 RepID=A0AAW2U4J6_9LAMI